MQDVISHSTAVQVLCVLFCFPDIDIVLMLRVPKALTNTEACMEQKVKCSQRISSIFVGKKLFFPSQTPSTSAKVR